MIAMYSGRMAILFFYACGPHVRAAIFMRLLALGEPLPPHVGTPLSLFIALALAPALFRVASSRRPGIRVVIAPWLLRATTTRRSSWERTPDPGESVTPSAAEGPGESSPSVLRCSHHLPRVCVHVCVLYLAVYICLACCTFFSARVCVCLVVCAHHIWSAFSYSSVYVYACLCVCTCV